MIFKQFNTLKKYKIYQLVMKLVIEMFLVCVEYDSFQFDQPPFEYINYMTIINK